LASRISTLRTRTSNPFTRHMNRSALLATMPPSGPGYCLYVNSRPTLAERWRLHASLLVGDDDDKIYDQDNGSKLKNHAATEFDPGQDRREIAARDGALAPDEAGTFVALSSLHPKLLLLTVSTMSAVARHVSKLHRIIGTCSAALYEAKICPIKTSFTPPFSKKSSKATSHPKTKHSSD